MGSVKELKKTKGQNAPTLAVGKSSRASDVQVTGFSSKGNKQSKRNGIVGRKNQNPKIKGEKYQTVSGHKGFELVKSGTKRKRVCAGKYSDDERDPMNDAQKVVKPTRNGKSKYAEPLKRADFLKGRSKMEENGLSVKKKSRGDAKVATEVQDLEADKCSSGKLKKGGKSKLDAVKKLERKIQSKKGTSDDNERLDERPRKRRRVIRIDPHDDSNKRLDDGLMTNDAKEKKDSSKNSDVQLSKNAQFRAIRPSPSILSFVEDNLLGRRREIAFRRAGYNIELSAPLDNIPFSPSAERERIEEMVFRNKLEFFAAAKVSSSFPPPDLPEIAFAGRSNVGKSSLLNSLTRQWGVARTSDKPGLTQTINFFKLGSKLCLVDLPGYGFAYAKEEVKEAWEELVKEYVSTRAGLKRVCLLIDTKWGMKPRDFELIDLMERYQTKYQIVLTKTDLVFPIDVARRATQIEENLKEKKSAIQPVMMVSSKTGAGVRSLRTVLCKMARFLKP